VVSNFGFLRSEWPELYEPARRAELAVYADPRAACFYARRGLELAVSWMFANDSSLRLPYDDNLSSMLHEPTFQTLVGTPLFYKARAVKDLGNRAVHKAAPIPSREAMGALGQLFQVLFWVARTYSREQRPADRLRFDPEQVPRVKLVQETSLEQMRQQAEELKAKDAELAEAKRLAAEAASGKDALDAELAAVKAELAEVKKRNQQQPDTHDYSESETRDLYIDLLLSEAGWDLDDARNREVEVEGMPTASGKGFVDYVLWGDDGLPLAVIEAKRTRVSPQAGQQQARLYADRLQARYGRRPIIFYSNGYEHWLWDDVSYPPRQVQGFFTKAELELMVQRRTTRQPLGSVEISSAIVERYYQHRAIRSICESFDADRQRKALLVMATGSGKTRTVIALVDVLQRAGWVKRVLFLADRTALVNQAVGAFKAHLPDSAPVNLVTDKTTDGRVFVSTYPSMMNLIDDMTSDGRRRFGPGFFDMIVIDEAHRSVFAKYRGIFDYFDAMLVGLTATPKDEVDRNTYNLFDLEPGVPTDAYTLDEAVKDGFLVPPRAVSVPLRFVRQGIRYDDLTEQEKDEWDALDWGEEADVPDRVDAQAVNKWLFNADTVDKVLAHLMEHGLKVAGGDRLAKTILFAKNQAHADFIAERFDVNYPHLRGQFARVISYKVEYAQTLIDDFSNPAKDPHLAISVDMLDTGIDIPQVGNLVFFKLVRSKTKFWQMLGRGTRLSPDLLGPGADKKFFYLFDYCGNLEYFSQDLPEGEGSVGVGLSARIFAARVELLTAIDAVEPQVGDRVGSADDPDPSTLAGVRRTVAGVLHRDVASMNTDNFLVRPHRRLVERYATRQAWQSLTDEQAAELEATVSRLPASIPAEGEEAKRFDLLALRLQLGLLRAEPGFLRLVEQVKSIAGLLEEKTAIPLVNAQMSLIQGLQTDEYWTDITVSMLEVMRRRIRGLVQFIEATRRNPIFTDFEDEIGDGIDRILPGFDGGTSLDRFRSKVEARLADLLQIDAVRKIHDNQPITAEDLSFVEQALVDAGVGTVDEVQAAAENASGLGLFIRSVVGLDRSAAKAAMADSIDLGRLGTVQIQFVNLVVDYLTSRGVLPAEALYEDPFTGIAPEGPDGLFPGEQVDRLIEALHAVHGNAVA
jgi:type I restriction enzyme R subunit